MNHVAEHLIEFYVRHPEELDAITQQSVAGHVEACSACRSIAEFLRPFYAELETLDGKVSPQWEAWLAEHFPRAHVIPLHPFRPEPEESCAYSANAVVLAAMTRRSRSSGTRFQTVATLASRQQDVLLRILRDNESDTYRLYVLSHDPRQRRHAVISFPDLPLEVATDENGQARFQLAGDMASRKWESLNSILRLPVCEVRVPVEQLRQAAPPDFVTIGEANAPEYAIRISYADNLLELEVRPRRQETPDSELAVVRCANDQTSATALQGGRGRVPLASLPEIVQICFY